MNTYLTRAQFLNQRFSPEQLQSLEVMLTDWFLQRAAGRGSAISATARIRGFPQADGPALRELIAGRLAAQGTGAESVSLADPDILTVASGSLPAGPDLPTPPIGAFLHAAADPAFEGLWCEFRLEFDGRFERTVVLAGLLCGASLDLKAIWTTGAASLDEGLFVHSPWPEERQLLASLDDYWFRGNRAAPRWARQHLFPEPFVRTVTTATFWFLRPTKGSLLPFLLRVGIPAAIAGACLAGLANPYVADPGMTAALTLGLFLAAGALCYLVVHKLRLVTRTLRTHKANLRKLFSGPIRYLETDPSAGRAGPADPAVRKLSAEISALGGRHYRDVIPDPAPPGNHLFRMYYFPGESIRFTLMLMRQNGKQSYFPARPNFHLQTKFDDGWKLVSTTDGSGWRKPLPLPIVQRVFPGVTDPAIALEKHRRAVHRQEENGRRVVPIDPDRIIPAMMEQNEAIREAIRKYGYFHWSDAVRMIFKIPRREYLEP